MPPTNPEFQLQCPVSVASTFFGEPWSMLILREFMIFGGSRRFDQLYNALGISKNVLTKRLKHFQNLGLVRKEPLTPDSKRMHYRLRRKAWELTTVMMALHQWAVRWGDPKSKSQLEYLNARTNLPLEEVAILGRDGNKLSPADIKVKPRSQQAQRYIKKYSNQKSS